MIKLILLEDELPARKKLVRMIDELQLKVEILAEIESVEGGIAYFQSQPMPDLIISDIELRDGNSFELFQNVPLSCPIIFTTAYNEFWMEAFESNGIAYLLKPFSLDKLKQAWDKFELLTRQSPVQTQWLQGLQAMIRNHGEPQSTYKTRFSIPTTKGTYFLEVKNISYFLAEGGLVYAKDESGKKHLMRELTLKEIEEAVDPHQFFRINRSELVQKSYIQGLERYTKNAIGIKLNGINRLLICSQSQTPPFLKWIER